MTLQDYLDELGVHYHVSNHSTAYTSQDLAAAEHVTGKKIIKPVLVHADHQIFLCALPASSRIDLGQLREQLHAEEGRVADEKELLSWFPDCERGAEPPIGRLYGLPTIMEESLSRDEQVTFQAGTHTRAMTMSLADYRRAAQPAMAKFAM
jgi:Ala-tRNA(Pro) deacylase